MKADLTLSVPPYVANSPDTSQPNGVRLPRGLSGEHLMDWLIVTENAKLSLKSCQFWGQMTVTENLKLKIIFCKCVGHFV